MDMEYWTHFLRCLIVVLRAVGDSGCDISVAWKGLNLSAVHVTNLGEFFSSTPDNSPSS
jgi:hypothetical protein